MAVCSSCFYWKRHVMWQNMKCRGYTTSEFQLHEVLFLLNNSMMKGHMNSPAKPNYFIFFLVLCHHNDHSLHTPATTCSPQPLSLVLALPYRLIYFLLRSYGNFVTSWIWPLDKEPLWPHQSPMLSFKGIFFSEFTFISVIFIGEGCFLCFGQ